MFGRNIITSYIGPGLYFYLTECYDLGKLFKSLSRPDACHPADYTSWPSKKPVPWVCCVGCCMQYRSSVFHIIGSFSSGSHWSPLNELVQSCAGQFRGYYNRERAGDSPLERRHEWRVMIWVERECSWRRFGSINYLHFQVWRASKTRNKQKQGASPLRTTRLSNPEGRSVHIHVCENLNLELLGFWTFSIVWYSRNQKDTTFRKLDLFPSSGMGKDTYGSHKES
jgi:hypothetical protein